MPLHYRIGFDDYTPKTADDATPIAFEDVKNAHVIHVLDAEHRNAALNGTFEIADNEQTIENNSIGFNAKCYWFGCKPPNSWMLIKLKPNQWREQKGYSGAVIRNIGRVE